jgi:predicted ATPase
VLENVEHLLAAVPVISELLEGCQHLRLLVTSRSVLRLRVEQRFPVAPLPTPPDELLPVDAIAASPSVRLFVERAQSVNADFTLDDGNARAVAAICRRLDGVPLAIELAAARVSLLRPEALLRRLERRLPLLTGGAADLPERQQTLVKTLAWSHGLLGQRDQAVFRRLAVFEGGCTLEAVEKVCAFREHVNDAFVGPSTSNDELTADEMLESVQSLIDNSLLRPTPTQNGLRLFVMLETIREYAYECLTHSGEAERARSRHLAWYLSLAEHAAAELTGPQQAQWLEHLDLMLDNMRAALSWAYASRQIEVGLRLAGALGRFWATRRYVGEGREWLERFLEAGSGLEIAAAVRAPATYAAGLLASIQGDYAWAVQRLEQSTSFYRAAGDLLGAVRAQNTRAGVTYDQGNRADALAQWEQTLQDARLTGNLGDVAHLIGNQGEALFHMGDLAAAEARHEDALALARRAGRTDVEAMQLGNLGNVARERGDLAVASDFHRQALTIKQQLGARRQIAITLADMASVAGAAGQGIRAARLLAAAMALRETIGLPQPVPERTGMLRAVTPALAELNEEARETAFAEGRAFTLEQAIAYAME